MSRFHRGTILRIRDQRWSVEQHVLHPAASVVHVRGCERSNRDERAAFLAPFDHMDAVAADDAPGVVSPASWRVMARRVLATAAASWNSVRTLVHARVELLPFQLEPVLAIVRGVANRILIADEVGLGKTIEAGMIAAEILERDADARVLIVTPATVREQWQQELAARFGLAAVVLDGGRPHGHSAAAPNPWTTCRVTIASIDFVKRPEVLRALESVVWDLVVFDEAHRLAGTSDRHAAATLIGERARAVVLLTATPHTGDADLFSRLCAIGDLSPGFPLLAFRRTRQSAGVDSQRRTRWLRTAPSLAERAMHRLLDAYVHRVWHEPATAGAARLAMTVLTKRACSAAASLARSVERRLELLGHGPEALQLSLPLAPSGDDEEPGAELGAPGLADAHAERTLLERLLLAARRAERDDTKLHAVRRLLRRSGEPAIIFTEYRDTLRAVAAALEAFRVGQLHGGLTRSERADVLRQFASGELDVLLATDTASEGLNLHHRCRLVVNLEVPWTPARLEQRVGRVDRIGQTRRVHAVHLVAARTVEERRLLPVVQARLLAIDDALTALQTPPLGEGEVAETILGGKVPTASRPAVDLPRGCFVAPLLQEAMAETALARRMRALLAAGAREAFSAEAPHRRRFAASLHVHPRQACWAVQIPLVDADDDEVLELLFGVSRGAVGPVRSSADVRTRLFAGLPHVLWAASAAYRNRATEAAEELRPGVEMAIAREQAIEASIIRRHAQLAAAVVQGHLFDRRAERTSAVQELARDEAVAGCRQQLRRLERRRHLRPASAALVFAVLTR